jgi:hypothetical protein
MKYFTEALWIEVQVREPVRRRRVLALWKRRQAAYERQLEPVLASMPKQARQFFRLHRMHDCELITVRAEPAKMRARRHQAYGYGEQCVHVVASRDDDTVELTYRGVSRLEVRAASDAFCPHQHLGSWGYDELTSVGNGVFRHEVLFSSGSLLVEFRRFSYGIVPVRR